ncbi:3-oxoacyl-(acyl-carrier-protein) reductase FabG [Gammaproteobacteria bacterium]
MSGSESHEDLKGKVAIVTGSARGIGRAIALALANRGADVVISDVLEDAARVTADEIIALGQRSLAARCNVINRGEVDNLIQQTVTELGRLDILVNNAGITQDTLMIRMSEEQWDRVLDINLKGTFFACQSAAKVMIKARSGKIVNIASVVGLTGNIGQVNYAASKAGVIALTKTLSKELASRNINVNSVAPGFIETDMTKQLSDAARKMFLDNIPLSRAGSPEDVANAVVFLCSPAANYITGHCLTVDGGMTSY